MKILLILAVLLLWPPLAEAQWPNRNPGYTIITPGQPPTFVNPNGAGGYTAITPGYPPTFVNRTPMGWTILTPGRPPTWILGDPRSIHGPVFIPKPGADDGN